MIERPYGIRLLELFWDFSIVRIHLTNDVGRSTWQEATSYGKRAGVENTNSRYKTIIGGKLKSKDTDNQNTEIQIGVRILNRMRALGIPKGRRAS